MSSETQTTATDSEDQLGNHFGQKTVNAVVRTLEEDIDSRVQTLRA